MMLRIGEFSRRGRVSVKALRHYEAIGLMRPANVDAATGYRSYAAEQLDELHRLMVLRALGLSLERIRQVLQDHPSPERMRRLLDERRAAVARRIDAEQAQLAAIEAASGTSKASATPRPAPSCATCRRRSWPACAASCPTTEQSIHCSTRSPAPCPTPPASPGTVRCGITARRTSSRSIARRWCCWSDQCRRGLALKLYQLPACRAACVVHPSDEEDFASARAAAKAAVANQPLEIEGPMRGRYFLSAGDSRFDLTEIQFPLRATGALP